MITLLCPPLLLSAECWELMCKSHVSLNSPLVIFCIIIFEHLSLEEAIQLWENQVGAHTSSTVGVYQGYPLSSVLINVLENIKCENVYDDHESTLVMK